MPTTINDVTKTPPQCKRNSHISIFHNLPAYSHRKRLREFSLVLDYPRLLVRHNNKFVVFTEIFFILQSQWNFFIVIDFVCLSIFFSLGHFHWRKKKLWTTFNPAVNCRLKSWPILPKALEGNMHIKLLAKYAWLIAVWRRSFSFFRAFIFIHKFFSLCTGKRTKEKKLSN